MGFDQYHEPPDELLPEARTFARMSACLTEEAEAIGWYQERLGVETDQSARAIMRNAQEEELKHFSMDLEFLVRSEPTRRATSCFRRATSSRTARPPRRRPASVDHCDEHLHPPALLRPEPMANASTNALART